MAQVKILQAEAARRDTQAKETKAKLEKVRFYLTESVYKVVLEKSIPAQIRHIVLLILIERIS